MTNPVKLWSTQLWTQFYQFRREAWKIQDFNGVWTRDVAMPVRRSNQLSYEATDVGSWSFLSSYVSVINKPTNEIIYQWWNGIWNESYMNCGYEIKWSNDLRSIAPESRGHGFKPRWSPEFFRLLYAIAKIALITAKIIASLEIIYEMNHIWNCGYEIKWTYDLRSYERKMPTYVALLNRISATTGWISMTGGPSPNGFAFGCVPCEMKRLLAVTVQSSLPLL